MTDDQHRKLAAVLRNVKGKVALSGYHCDLHNELYGDWYVSEALPKKAHSTNTRADAVKQDRVEVLWTNYQPPQPQPLEE